MNETGNMRLLKRYRRKSPIKNKEHIGKIYIQKVIARKPEPEIRDRYPLFESVLVTNYLGDEEE